MSALNPRDYNLKLELSIPESIPCTKRDVLFPITNIDFPTLEVVSNYVGLLPNIHHGRDLNKGVKEGYEPKPYDYYSVPRIKKNWDYKIHCISFVKDGLLYSLETWWKKLNDSTFGKVKKGDLYVPSRIVGYDKCNNKLSNEKIKCSDTFIIDCVMEGIDCDFLYITFICDEMVEDNNV